MSKILSKYINVFDYIGKTIIVLSATSRRGYIISFATAIGASAGIESASFTLVFSFTKAILRKLLSITRTKKEKQ